MESFAVRGMNCLKALKAFNYWVDAVNSVLQSDDDCERKIKLFREEFAMSYLHVRQPDIVNNAFVIDGEDIFKIILSGHLTEENLRYIARIIDQCCALSPVHDHISHKYMTMGHWDLRDSTRQINRERLHAAQEDHLSCHKILGQFKEMFVRNFVIKRVQNIIL